MKLFSVLHQILGLWFCSLLKIITFTSLGAAFSKDIEVSKLIGSTLIVAGTAIGGGMLAMPIISSGVGFRGITVVLFILWLVMCFTALLMVELYKYNDPSDGFNTLTKKYLGNVGSAVMAVSMLSLMYALLAAYVTGGGDIFTSSLNTWLGISLSPQVGIIVFTVFFGGMVAFGTRYVDHITKGFFAIKLIALAALLFFLVPFVRVENLAVLPVEDVLIFAAIPVIFTSFGFHVVIPSLVKYLAGDMKKLRWVMVVGSTIPLVVYLVWQAAILGSINNEFFRKLLGDNAGLEGLLLAISTIAEISWVKGAVHIFAGAAILTSFLGVAMALFDYIKDVARNTPYIRTSFGAILTTFIPPLAFALYYPKGFVMALSYASVSLVVLSIVLPILMLIKAKQRANEKITKRVQIGFVLSTLIAILILGIQVASSLGKI